MKRILIASEDLHTLTWVQNAVSGLDVSAQSVGSSEMQRHLVDGGIDLVVLDAGRDVEVLVQVVEHAVSEGVDVRLLTVIPAESLPRLRLPSRLRSDFFVRGGAAEELAARVRTLLWPGEEVTQQEIVRLEGLTLNLATYQAYLDSSAIDFTYLEYALFAFLVTHPGRTYSREVLLRRVWGSDYYGGSRTVDVHIRRIRAKIGGELSHRLETVRNVGYLWNAS